jgi:hypothetical protein
MSNTEKHDQEEIVQQQGLLAIYRRTLAHLLQQAAQYGGETYAPPHISNGLHEAREHIRQIKAALRTRHVSAEDAPEEEPSLPQLAAESSAPSHGAPAKTIGTLQNVATGGGDYAESSIDKRQGAFVSGGTVYGPVVGSNVGTITAAYDTPIPGNAPPSTLESALAQLQQTAMHARQRGDDDLAEDLEGIVRVLQQGLKARSEGKAERLAAKLREAKEMLGRFAEGHPALSEMARMLDQVA